MKFEIMRSLKIRHCLKRVAAVPYGTLVSKTSVLVFAGELSLKKMNLPQT